MAPACSTLQLAISDKVLDSNRVYYLRDMSQGFKHSIREDKSYFLTITTVGWVDVFTRENHRDAIIDSLRYCIENKGLHLYAYCLMPSHLHLIANAEDGNLADIIRDFKRYTSTRIKEQIAHEPESRREWMTTIFEIAAKERGKRQGFKLWKSGNHAIELSSPAFTWKKVQYIHNNPVAEGFVNSPEHWRYSSASNYMEHEKVVLPGVECLLPPIKTVS